MSPAMTTTASVSRRISFLTFANGAIRKAPFRILQPCRITEGNHLVFAPTISMRSYTGPRVDVQVESGSIFALKRATKISLPAFANYAEYSDFIGRQLGDQLGPSLAPLLQADAQFLMAGNAPNLLSIDDKSELAQLTLTYNEKSIVYLKKESVYLLVDTNCTRSDCPGKLSYTVPAGKGKLTAVSFPSAESLIDFLALPKTAVPTGDPAPDPTPPAVPEVDPQLLAQDQLIQESLTTPLPPTQSLSDSARVGTSQVGDHLIAVSHLGNVRKSNEDAYLFTEDGLMVVCDGMGGHDAGEVASDCAIRVIHGVDRKGLPPEKGILLAHLAIRKKSPAGSSHKSMGTTAVAAKVTGNNVRIAYAGDSRAYIFSGKEAAPIAVTADHSQRYDILNTVLTTEGFDWPIANSPILAEVRAAFPKGLPGYFTGSQLDLINRLFQEYEAKKSSLGPDYQVGLIAGAMQSNYLVRALGKKQKDPSNQDNDLFRASVLTGPLQPGDWLLLCSDGLHGELPNLVALIADCKRKGMSAAETGAFIRDEVLKTKAGDNFTFILHEHLAAAEPAAEAAPAAEAPQAEEPDLASVIYHLKIDSRISRETALKLLQDIFTGRRDVAEGTEDDAVMEIEALMQFYGDNAEIQRAGRNAQNFLYS